MNARATAHLDSLIFDKATREQAIESFVGKQAKEFKAITKERIVEEQHTGSLYGRKRGEGFRRSHRASARGERPAIDTGRLLNSIEDKQLSPTQAEVAATATSDSGWDYPWTLQNSLQRPIMSDDDAWGAEIKMKNDANELLRKLI